MSLTGRQAAQKSRETLSFDRSRIVKGMLSAIIMMISGGLMAQDATLKGTVYDKETGETLPGATVSLVGTYIGTSTDMEGKYVLENIKPGDYSVKITFIGYSDQL